MPFFGSKKKDLEEKEGGAKEEKSASRMWIEENQFQTDDKRKCRDVLFLILFLAMWMGMFVIAGVSVGKGEPKKLFYGSDHAGRQCGGKGSVVDGSDGMKSVDYDFTKLTFTAYPQLSKDVKAAYAAGIQDPTKISVTGECVAACPTVAGGLRIAKTWPKGTAPATTALLTSSGLVNAATCTPGTKCWESTSVDTESLFFRCLPSKKSSSTVTVECTVLNGGTTPTGREAESVSCGPGGQNQCEKKLADHFAANAATSAGCATSRITDLTRVIGSAAKDPIYDQMSGTFQKVARWVGDVEKSAVPILLSGGLCGMVFSILYLYICGMCATLMVTIVVALIMFTLIAITLYLASLGNLINVSNYCSGASCAELSKAATATQDKESLYAALAYVFAVITAIVFVMLIFMRSRLKLATKMITMANGNMMKRKSIFAWPIIPTFFSLLFLVYFVIIGAYIATVGEVEYKDANGTVVAKPAPGSTSAADVAADYAGSLSMQYLLAYHLFGFLWTNNLLEAIGAFVVASVVGGVYWADEENKTRAVRQGLRRALKFHLGSLAFGSLVLSIVEFVRIALEYIDHKVKKAAEHNKILKAALCCLKSFAYCLQKCVEFINKNCYILIACRGQSFCTSAREAFSIILSNIATIATVSTISNFLILLGKVTITCLCMLIFNGFINGASWVESIPTFQANVDMGDISSPIFPMLVVCLFAFAVASYFLNIYSMAIDTVLMCYMVDTREYKVKFGALFCDADPTLDATLKLADAKYTMAIHKSKGKRSGKGGTPTAESAVKTAELTTVSAGAEAEA